MKNYISLFIYFVALIISLILFVSSVLNLYRIKKSLNQPIIGTVVKSTNPIATPSTLKKYNFVH